MISFELNGKQTRYEGAADKPLLWFLREDAHLTGTKYGCGIAQCGSCTVFMDDEPARSCSIPMSSVDGRTLITIEAVEGRVADAVINAWNDIDVVQCGYCQSGQIISAISLLQKNNAPDDTAIDNGMNGNLCRCATYHRIREAIQQASRTLKESENSDA